MRKERTRGKQARAAAMQGGEARGVCVCVCVCVCESVCVCRIEPGPSRVGMLWGGWRGLCECVCVCTYRRRGEESIQNIIWGTDREGVGREEKERSRDTSC